VLREEDRGEEREKWGLEEAGVFLRGIEKGARIWIVIACSGLLGVVLPRPMFKI
jgi:hypothetical protein